MVAVLSETRTLSIFDPIATPPSLKRLPTMRHTPPPTYATPWTRRFPMFPGATPRRRAGSSLSTPRMSDYGAATPRSAMERPSTTSILDPLQMDVPRTSSPSRPQTSRSEWGAPAPLDMGSSACQQLPVPFSITARLNNGAIEHRSAESSTSALTPDSLSPPSRFVQPSPYPLGSHSVVAIHVWESVQFKASFTARLHDDCSHHQSQCIEASDHSLKVASSPQIDRAWAIHRRTAAFVR